MKLTSVDVQGFKSFATKTQLAFDDGITAIIGPNGSGKSNMAEAVRWVLGEQSLKSLRGKQSVDVIFSGTDGKGQARKASVKLTFDNESGRFPLEAPEIAVSRTLNREGESEYMVNGEPVRLLDLQQLLAEAGIGAKSYTVISQGMVDRYLTASPDARRELFDEATGVRPLQLKMQQAEKKLRATRKHAYEVHTVMEELVPRLQVLQRQVKRQQEREELMEMFEKKQRIWFFTRWHEAHMSQQQAQQAAEAAKGAAAEARRERQRIEEAVFARMSQGAPAEHLREQVRAAEAELAASEKEYESAQRQRAELGESIASAQKQLRAAEAELAAARESSLHFDWLKTVRGLLRKSQQAIQGKIPAEDVKTLDGEISRFLSDIRDASSVDMARSVLNQMEAPLSEAARLKAVLEERTRQLASVPDIQKPTDEKVRRARALLKSQGGQQASPIPQGTMEAAREAELAAEREGSAAQAAAAGAAQELRRVEQEILRERGTGLLQEIQESTPTAQENVAEDELRTMSARIASLGEIDELALKEYTEVKERYAHLQQQMQDVIETEQNILRLQEQLSQQIEQHFGQQFQIITEAFAKYFVQLFGGGQADLALSEAGINITATPPGKRARNVSLLSGGEKALTSLALLLAILEAQQPPFAVLDEVDAALDEANSERLANILREKSHTTQIIVISHNRSTMAAAHVLYGVTMQQDGVSKVYSVRLSEVADAVGDNARERTVKM